jgi:hypothetical protein
MGGRKIMNPLELLDIISTGDEMTVADTGESDIDKEKVVEYMKKIQKDPEEMEQMPSARY